MINNPSEGITTMTGNLEGKTGEQFDRAFISAMIVHHQSAVDMAQLAKQNAEHGEVKKLAVDIISAQSEEINTLKQWQKDWGYPTNNKPMSAMNSAHSGGNCCS